jgi:steroid delta-isomerase
MAMKRKRRPKVSITSHDLSDGHPKPEPGRAAGAELVRRYYELVDSGDVDRLVALFAPDAVYHRPGYEPRVGHAELNRFYRGERVIQQGRHTLTNLVTSDHRIAVEGEFSGTLKDGRQVSLRFADFFTEDGKGQIARRDTYFLEPLV